MTNSAQARIAAMESALNAHAAENGNRWARYNINVMATSRGWVVYIDSERVAEAVDALDAALAIAEAHVRRTVSSIDNLARTLGIAS
jgi:hypothetical protein